MDIAEGAVNMNNFFVSVRLWERYRRKYEWRRKSSDTAAQEKRIEAHDTEEVHREEEREI